MFDTTLFDSLNLADNGLWYALAAVITLALLRAVTKFTAQRARQQQRGRPRIDDAIISEAMKTHRERVPPSVRAAPAREVPAAWSLDLLRGMSRTELRSLCMHLWSAQDYRAEERPIGDLGSGFRLRSGNTAAFAVAWCDSDVVGIGAAEEVLKAMMVDRAAIGLIYGTHGFAPEVKTLAAEHMVKLISGDQVLRMIQALGAAEQAQLRQGLRLHGRTEPQLGAVTRVALTDRAA